MKDRSKLIGQPLQLVAAAVVLAFGSAPLVAQEPVTPEPFPESEQQQQPADRDWQDDELGQERQDDPFADDPAADDEWDRDLDVAAADTGGEGLDQLAQEYGDLSTFVEAVKAAGMEDALTDGTSYTIFAPTNEAFEQMDSERLLQSENWEETAELLRAHIVADDVDAEKARSTPQALTLDGGAIEISERDGELMVDNATVVQEDIQHGSLRIHTIDSVLDASPGEIDIATRDEEWDDGLSEDAPADDGFRDDGFGDDNGLRDDGGFGDDGL